MKLYIPKIIVTYHDFKTCSIFEKQLQNLSKRQDVLLTTDDGDISFYTTAFPLIVKYNIPAILFIIPSLIGTEDPFWWNEVYYYLGREAGVKKVRELKVLPNKKRVEYLSNLREQHDKEPLKQRQLTIDQLQEMQSKGVMIANHSFTHPLFDQCSESEIRAELKNTKAFFETHKLKGYEVFAYPNGSHNELSEKILKEEGIEYAFLFDHKINDGKINPLRISRLSLNDCTPILKFRFILSGWHSKVLPLTKTVYKILHK
jgi:peptidoglycan/xylan/chitin deacetylase (PgdA/CDA1 family)